MTKISTTHHLTDDKTEQLSKKINESKTITLITHTNPDGDAIGCLLGVYNFLKSNKNVFPMVPNTYPDFLSWMPGNEKVLVYDRHKNECDKILQETDIIICLDFNAISRIDKIENELKKSNAYKVLIDHHPSPENFADLIISETNRSSAAELTYDVLKSIDSKLINNEVAECIMCGIMTDTGCFSFNSSNPNTYRIVAELLEKKINKDRIFNKVYETFSVQRMRLLGFCLNERMKILANNKVAMIYLAKTDQEKFDYKKGDSEAFVNIPFSIKGINVSALIMEIDDRIKISFRSKGKFDVNLMARQHFNGGGHKNAAGGHMFDSLEKTIELFENVINQISDEVQYNFSECDD